MTMIKYSRKDRIKVSDRVRIINPQLVVRVGYPLCIEDVAKTIDVDKIVTALHNCGIKHPLHGLVPNIKGSRMERAMSQVARGIALAIMIDQNFGGSTRSIYTSEDLTLKNAIVRVSGKRRVVTGDRYGGYEEGPSLENQVHHMLIQFDSPKPMIRILDTGEYSYEIEECNVSKDVREEYEESKDEM